MKLPAAREELRTFTESVGAAKNNNDETTRDRHGPPAFLDDLRFPICGENQAITGARGPSCLHPIDPIRAEQFIGIPQDITVLFTATGEGNLPFLLRNVKGKARLVHGITRQPHHIRSGRVRERTRGIIDAVWIHKMRSIHPESFRQRIHLADENRDRDPALRGRSRNDRLERDPNMVRQGVGCDVVRLDEGRVKQIAQRDRVARLETNEVFARADKRFGWKRRDLVEVAGSFVGPVEHDHRCRDFGQASNLTFLPWLPLIQNAASLRIYDGEGLSSVEGAAPKQAEREREKSDEKAARDSHGRVKSLHLSRRGLVGNGNQARCSIPAV